MIEKQVIIVTGASRGIGRNVALWLGKQGQNLVITARSEDAILQLSAQIEQSGGKAVAIQGDISSVQTCRNVIESAVEKFGKIDAIVNNAGVLSPLKPVAESDMEQWRQNIEINVLGPYYLSRLSIPYLRKTKGRVVNVSSGAARQAIEGWSAYCASKAALTLFTQVLAAEEPDITSVALRPGVVDTQMQGQIRDLGPGNMAPEKVDYFTGLKSGGKLASPAIPARCIAYLALFAKKRWSGEFMDYQDDRVFIPAAQLFGESL